MFSRCRFVVPVLVLGAGLVAFVPSASARKKTKPTAKPSATPVPTLTTSESAAVYEAVLLWSLKNGKQNTEEPVYVAFGRQDPPNTFIERMKKRGVHVVGMSKSPMPFARGDRGDANPKNPQFVLGPIQKLDATHASVYYDYVFGGDTFTLQLEDELWKVTRREMKWIS